MGPDLWQTAALWLPWWARTFGLVALLPLWTDTNAIPQKCAAALCLALAVGYRAQAAPASPLELILLVLANGAIGAVLSMPLVLVLEAAASYGETLDGVRGVTIAQHYDALRSENRSLLSGSFAAGVWAAALFSGAAPALAGILAASRVITAQVISNDAAARLARAVLASVLHAAAMSLEFALPFAALCFLLEIAIGLVSLCAPRVSLQGEALLAKSAALALLLPSWIGWWAASLAEWENRCRALFF
jgi:type III secretory pathway component EscT